MAEDQQKTCPGCKQNPEKITTIHEIDKHERERYTVPKTPRGYNENEAYAHHLETMVNESRLNRQANERTASALERIATALEASDERAALDESVKVWGTNG